MMTGALSLPTRDHHDHKQLEGVMTVLKFFITYSGKFIMEQRVLSTILQFLSCTKIVLLAMPFRHA